MLKRLTKAAVRGALAPFGLELRRVAPPAPPEVIPPPVPEPIPEPIPEPPAPAVRGVDSMEEFLHFLRALEFRPKCVLDVGANETWWTKLAAGVFPEARFVLVEPQSEMMPDLTAFCSRHPDSRIIAAGAGPEPGQAVFTVWEDRSGSSFIPGADDALIASGRQRVLPIVTIDAEFEGEAHLPDLVKLDVQGYELEALKGASRLFGHTEVFVLEVSLVTGTAIPPLAEVVAFMAARGYQVYDICGFLRRPLDDALSQVDLVFARTDGVLCRDKRWSADEGTLNTTVAGKAA